MIGLLAICAIPTVTGVCISTSESRKQEDEKDDEVRMAKFNVVARAEDEDADNGRSSTRRERVRRQIDGQYVVLRDGKVSRSLSSLSMKRTSGPGYQSSCVLNLSSYSHSTLSAI